MSFSSKNDVILLSKKCTICGVVFVTKISEKTTCSFACKMTQSRERSLKLINEKRKLKASLRPVVFG